MCRRLIVISFRFQSVPIAVGAIGSVGFDQQRHLIGEWMFFGKARWKARKAISGFLR